MRRPAMLFETLEDGKAACLLCSHRCRIGPSKSGICGVRHNRGGKLETLVYGEVIAAHVDPIEKKPLYHYLPGTRSFSIATVGCNFRCSFCQNWQISQATKGRGFETGGQPLTPEEVVASARRHDCRSVSYTYTEPTVFFEYAFDTARLARAAGLGNVFVTNGFMTPEALETISPFLDACNVDLKSFRDESYKKICQARLQPVLDSIRLMRRLGIWVEVTTLVVPGLNDSSPELRDIARFIAGIDPDIPWHISRFHPDFEYAEAVPTPLETLRRAAVIGREQGLRFIYVGNVRGEAEDTNCPDCGALLIRRSGFEVSSIRLRGGACPSCRRTIAGVFDG